MKELLMKRKKAFMTYVIACFFPVVNQLLGSLGIALFFGVITKNSMTALYQTIGIMLGLIVFVSGFQFLSRMLRIRFMRDTILDIRLAAFDKIINMDYERFGRQTKEVYLSNLINDINIFEQNFFVKLLNVIFRGGVYVISLIILAVMDWKFAFILGILSVIVLKISQKFEGKTVSLQEQVSTLNEEFSVKASNTFNGLEILKLNGIEDKFLDQTVQAIQKVERKRFHFTLFTESQKSLIGIMTYVIFIGILVYLMEMAFNGASIIKITFMLQIANGCIWPISQVLPLWNDVKASANIYEKITKYQGEDSQGIQGDLPFSFSKKIQVSQLNFSYENHDVIKNANFTIEKGKKYLIKGASGSGKTTLMKILSKIYEGYSGKIQVDDVDLKEISMKCFNDNISYVFQEVFLFEDTLRNNITLFKDYSEEAILNAVKLSGLSEFIDDTRGGLDMKIEENGKNLSGGQRQRISIARAILKQSDLLFADEATSSLNEALGSEIEATILGLDQTVLAISHRFYPGITNRYDYILEIKNGSIIQYDSDSYFEEVVA